MTLLRLEGLRVGFTGGAATSSEGEADNEASAVDGIDLSVEPGETVCLVGESGSGKSVTALALMGLLPDNARLLGGRAWLGAAGGETPVDLLRLPERAHRQLRGPRLAMIFQEPMTSLNPVMTVGEQIREVLTIHQPELDAETARARVVDVMTQVRLPDPESRYSEYPHRLSGGQRQRVMIAMALVCAPDLLIADEPTTALDVTVQAEILALLHDLQQRRRMGLLFITHDFGVVAQVAHRVAVMRRGRIVESGVTETLLRHAEHEYTRALLAALPERRARGERPAPGDETLVRFDDLKVHFPVRRGLLRRVVGQVKAVDGVSLAIPQGGITALVGESGSGKTTVGRALLRLVDATAGRIAFAGEDVTRLGRRSLRPFRRRVQAV
ncbi:MAG: ATP-binding cassette domain-containing protein, partial [Thiohalospira sp.]